jgi:hypothetical protein
MSTAPFSGAIDEAPANGRLPSFDGQAELDPEVLGEVDSSAVRLAAALIGA